VERLELCACGLCNISRWPLTLQVSFWIADSFNLNTFTIASSMIAAGESIPRLQRHT
jgi:cytosine/uracil/thiamine/allantoin permease